MGVKIAGGDCHELTEPAGETQSPTERSEHTMTNWYFPEDKTSPVFTAYNHIRRKFPEGQMPKLPPKAVLFCLGKGLPVLRERFQTETILEELTGFITHTPVYKVQGHDSVCFLHGGYGAPQATTTLESIHAMGVEEILVVGLCGIFVPELQVGDILLPQRILSEEGTSLHYQEKPGFARINPPASSQSLKDFLLEKGFTAEERDTVTTDAPYRQTFHKEALWREQGCAGVDMEASALVNLCTYYGMKSTVALMASDKHPVQEGDKPWTWGSLDFNSLRDNFIAACIEYSLR